MKINFNRFFFNLEIRNAVSIFHHPNILPFQIFMETEKAGFMIRQYFYNNLHDRIR